MAKETIFDPGTQEDHAFMLAKHMPVGRAWSNAFNPDSEMGKLIKGLAIEYYRLSVVTQKISTEMDINQTTDLITEWEKSVAIPDDCFTNIGSIEQRRLQVREKFANFGGVQTVADFERVAAVFGITATVEAGAATHTIEVTIISPIGELFPLDFPFPFGSSGEAFLQCLFDVLAPANVQVIFL